MGVDVNENELLSLEIIHRYVEILDKWFMNVCELDIIFNFQQAYTILDEVLIGGELQESSKRAVLNTLKRIEEVSATLYHHCHILIPFIIILKKRLRRLKSQINPLFEIQANKTQCCRCF